MYSSIAFNICIDSYNYHYNQDTEQFQKPKALILSLCSHSNFPTLETTSLSFVTVILSFPEVT